MSVNEYDPIDADEDEDDGVELHPPWREALNTFEAAGWTYGDVIRRKWFGEAFGLAVPNEQSRYTPRELEDYKLQFLANMSAFRRALLEQRQMDLDSDQRGSFIVIPPSEQGARAVRDTQRKIATAVERGIARVRYTNTALLSTEERREHMDSLTKLLDTQFRLGMRRRELPSGE